MTSCPRLLWAVGSTCRHRFIILTLSRHRGLIILKKDIKKILGHRDGAHHQQFMQWLSLASTPVLLLKGTTLQLAKQLNAKMYWF